MKTYRRAFVLGLFSTLILLVQYQNCAPSGGNGGAFVLGSSSNPLLPAITSSLTTTSTSANFSLSVTSPQSFTIQVGAIRSGVMGAPAIQQAIVAGTTSLSVSEGFTTNPQDVIYVNIIDATNTTVLSCPSSQFPGNCLGTYNIPSGPVANPGPGPGPIPEPPVPPVGCNLLNVGRSVKLPCP